MVRNPLDLLSYEFKIVDQVVQTLLLFEWSHTNYEHSLSESEIMVTPANSLFYSINYINHGMIY